MVGTESAQRTAEPKSNLENQGKNGTQGPGMVIDPEILDAPKVYAVGMALGAPDIIKNSRHGEAYCDWIRAHWSVRKCEQYALERYGEVIDKNSFHRLQQWIFANENLPVHYKDTVLFGVEADFGPKQELMDLALMQQDRVTKIGTLEIHLGTKHGKAIMPIKEMDIAISALQTTLKEIAFYELAEKKMRADMGESASAGQVAITDGQASANIEQAIQQACKTYTPEQAVRLLKIIEEVEAIHKIDIADLVDNLVIEEAVECCVVNVMRGDDHCRVEEYVKVAYSELRCFGWEDIRVNEFLNRSKQ